MHKGEERKVNDTTPPKAAQHSTQQNRKDEDNDCWHCTRGSGSDIGECTKVLKERDRTIGVMGGAPCRRRWT